MMNKTADGYELNPGDIFYLESGEICHVQKIEGRKIIYMEIDSLGYIGCLYGMTYKYLNNIPDYLVRLENNDRDYLCYILNEKVKQYKLEINRMKEYIEEYPNGRDGFLPRTLRLKGENALERVKENIDPWLSLIGSTEDLIKRLAPI